MLEDFRAKIVSGESTFEAIAEVESDCASAAQGGDVGPFNEGEMQAPFHAAVAALEVSCRPGNCGLWCGLGCHWHTTPTGYTL